LIHKTGLLTLILALTLTTASAAWTGINGGKTYSEPINLTFQNSTADDVTLWIQYPDSSDFEELQDVKKSGGTYYKEISGTIIQSGPYTFRANISQNGNYTLDEISLTIDTDAPSVSVSPSDGALISDSSPEISFDASDQTSSVKTSTESIRVTDSDGDVVDQADDSSVSLSGLTHRETYTVSYSVSDSVGNWNNGSTQFTVDTSYDGDTSPEIAEGHKPGVYRIGPSDESFKIPITLQPSGEDSAISVKCLFNNGEREFDSDAKFVTDTKTDFICELDPYARGEMQFDVSLKLVDAAGNSVPKQVGNYYFDIAPPTLGNLSTVVGVFNSDFQVKYDAYDTKDVEGLNVSKIHYQIDDSELDLERGVNVSEVDGEFRVNTSGLSAGEHTVYAWAVDEAGRTSSQRSLDFNFMPSASPKVSIGVDKELDVTAGDSRTVRVNVSNTGQLYIGGMQLNLRSDIANSSRSLDGLKPGERAKSIFSIDTVPGDLGVHKVDLSTESPDTSRTVRLVVEANKEQRKNISSKYSKYIGLYKALKDNVTGLKDSGLSSSREKRLDSNTSGFFSDMKAAKRAKEDGALYKVDSSLENISSDYSSAYASFRQVKKEHQKAQWNQTVGLFLLVFVALGGSGLAYVTYFSDEYYLDLDALTEEYGFLEGPVETVQTTLDQYEFSLAPLENAVAKVSELLVEEEEEVEEAEEQAFQGFT
ncbi:MAG: hypothetical protein ABEJ87_04730, partial [Candidatus Nanohalobium sp.]